MEEHIKIYENKLSLFDINQKHIRPGSKPAAPQSQLK
jgi:hypothetical protein